MSTVVNNLQTNDRTGISWLPYVLGPTLIAFLVYNKPENGFFHSNGSMFEMNEIRSKLPVLDFSWEVINYNVHNWFDVLHDIQPSPPQMPNPFNIHLSQLLYPLYTIIVLWWLHHFLSVTPRRFVEIPKLVYRASQRNAFIASRLYQDGHGCVKSFEPTFWAFNGHIQSFMFSAMPAPLNNSFLSNTYDHLTMDHLVEWVAVPEKLGGGAVAINWMTKRCASPIPDDAPILFLLPGVVGCAKDVYITRLAMHALNNGFRVVGKNWRGFGVELKGDRPETWCLQSVVDLDMCVRHVKTKYPDATKVVAAGFSTGGIMITTYLSMVGAQRHPTGKATLQNFLAECGLRGHTFCGLDSGVTISGLTDSKLCAFQIETIGWPPYSFGLSKLVITSMAEHIPQLERARKQSFRLADRRSSASMFSVSPQLLPHEGSSNASVIDNILGRDDVEGPMARLPTSYSMVTKLHRVIDYHNAITRHFALRPCATVSDFYNYLGEVHNKFLKYVVAPNLCFVADDDPLCTPLTFATVEKDAREATGVFLLRTKTGGHCGYFSGVEAYPWADAVTVRFLKATLEHQEMQECK